MYSVVESFLEDGKKESTCICHTYDYAKAENELNRLAKPIVSPDLMFSYEIIRFKQRNSCPVCKRNFEF